MALPLVEEASNDFAFSVPNKGKLKGFAWVWKERVFPKKPRVPNPGVLAVRVANLGQRDLMLSAEPVKFFTEPHYEGFPAVLVRLKEVNATDLKMLLAEGWRCQAPAELSMRGASATRAKSANLRKVTKVANAKTATRANPADSEKPGKRARNERPSTGRVKTGARDRTSAVKKR